MRVANWPAVLTEKIDEWHRRARSLEFGEADCCQFCADIVSALTGVEYRDRFPRYRSRKQALAILAKHGGMVGLVSSVLGEPKPAALAMRGDVVVADFGDGLAAAICIGVSCVTIGPEGVVTRPTAAAVSAWSVE